ncbi:MAG: hypothetical protein AAF467_04005 [Actinomycetota bacterium]
MLEVTRPRRINDALSYVRAVWDVTAKTTAVVNLLIAVVLYVVAWFGGASPMGTATYVLSLVAFAVLCLSVLVWAPFLAWRRLHDELAGHRAPHDSLRRDLSLELLATERDERQIIEAVATSVSSRVVRVRVAARVQGAGGESLDVTAPRLGDRSSNRAELVCGGRARFVVMDIVKLGDGYRATLFDHGDDGMKRIGLELHADSRISVSLIADDHDIVVSEVALDLADLAAAPGEITG